MMGEITASMGVQFTLSMGDNFYDNGVTSRKPLRYTDYGDKVCGREGYKQSIHVPAASYLYNYKVHFVVQETITV